MLLTIALALLLAKLTSIPLFSVLTFLGKFSSLLQFLFSALTIWLLFNHVWRMRKPGSGLAPPTIPVQQPSIPIQEPSIPIQDPRDEAAVHMVSSSNTLLPLPALIILILNLISWSHLTTWESWAIKWFCKREQFTCSFDGKQWAKTMRTMWGRTSLKIWFGEIGRQFYLSCRSKFIGGHQLAFVLFSKCI